MDILGVRIDNFSKQEILKKTESLLNEAKFHQITTINPEFILVAQKNAEFKQILNGGDLNVSDGFGISLAFLRFGEKLKCRFPGADLAHEILKIAEKRKIGVFLVINKFGLSSFEDIKMSLLRIYPELILRGEELNPDTRNYQLSIIDEKIIFCNFGAPNQEIFLDSIKNDKIRLAMGVGGTFDFVTGKAPRAPILMRKTGIEWLWRLLLQPKRIKRIARAVIVFPLKILFSKNV